MLGAMGASTAQATKKRPRSTRPKKSSWKIRAATDECSDCAPATDRVDHANQSDEGTTGDGAGDADGDEKILNDGADEMEKLADAFERALNVQCSETLRAEIGKCTAPLREYVRETRAMAAARM